MHVFCIVQLCAILMSSLEYVGVLGEQVVSLVSDIAAFPVHCNSFLKCDLLELDAIVMSNTCHFCFTTVCIIPVIFKISLYILSSFSCE